MAVEVVWSARAKAELVEIGAWIAIDDERAARRVIESVHRKAAALEHHPRIGVRRDDVRRSLRQLVLGPYLILYRTVPDTDDGLVERVQIVSVVDGRRDFRRLF